MIRILAGKKKAPTNVYKKRVLESAEVDFLASYYNQDGENAAVTGGIGTQKLQDVAPAIVIWIPLNDDEVLNVDEGISAYSSASPSNINPFDGNIGAGAFKASSGGFHERCTGKFLRHLQS